MPNLNTYIKEYGNISFCEKPFNEVDNIVLCNVFYMPYEKIVSDSFDDMPTPFTYASDRLFALRGNKHKPVGLILLKNISEQMMLMTNYKRYKEMKLVACTNVFEKKPDVQFNACTFLLPDGTVVVVFRGTDDSLRGWKEDFDILTQDNIPSQKLATDYLEQAAQKFDGDIIVCGHSKGGYVAQYGALFCKKEVRDRIKCLYNNDGPGFSDYSFIETENYKEMLPKYKHFVPQSSFIGMLLCHDDDYEVIKSKRITGPLEHDLSTWQISGDEIKRESGLTDMGKFNDLIMYHIVDGLDESQKAALDRALTADLDGTGQVGLLDVKDNAIAAVKGLVSAHDKIDKATQNTLKEIFADLDKGIASTAQAVRKGEFKTVKQRIKK